MYMEKSYLAPLGIFYKNYRSLSIQSQNQRLFCFNDYHCVRISKRFHLLEQKLSSVNELSTDIMTLPTASYFNATAKMGSFY